MSAELLLQAENLTRDYGARRAIDGISLSLARGEALGFLGPNGAGKSTTMRILSGALAPGSGQVRVLGRDMLTQPLAAKAHLGYLPERPPLYRELTVDEYLRFCARLHRVAARAVSAALAKAKSRTGLQQAGSRLIGNLSKGYQQRVGIAQAIIHAPPVVILDEPTVGLDPIQIREIRALIRELAADHGVILSTHILPEVQAVCDRVLIIHRGRQVLDAATGTLNSAPDLRIALSKAPALTELHNLPTVTSVTQVHPLAGAADAPARHFLLSGATLNSEAIAAHCVQHGWGLREITAQVRTLEEIFVNLTCGDTPASSPPAGAHTGSPIENTAPPS